MTGTFQMNFTQDKRTFFMADSGRGNDGGGGDDPYDRDDRLARSFKAALRWAENSSTGGTREFHSTIDQILERVSAAGHFVLVSQDLQPIAKRLLAIPGYSDKHNPGIVSRKFQGFDLSIEP